ncbi:MAG: hypothetical protein BA870_01765 [Desulfuromonadales bacterium C00003094]|nr:MAG: hypothetical protein BA870_01765 [Desulfuromonadales bacterium C00003094]
MDKVRLGTSSCLLGQNVRYDDGHPLNCYLRDTLRLFVNYVPVCPEVEMGLPIPRKTLCLVGESSAARLAATPAKHVNALQHTLGYFKHQLCADEKQEMLERFDQYRIKSKSCCKFHLA